MKDILYFNTLEDIKLTDMMRVSKKKEEHDYSKDYLTFEALENSVFAVYIPSTITSADMSFIEYSIDNGVTWNKTTINSTTQRITTPTVSAGSKVLWKGSGKKLSRGFNNGSVFYSVDNTKFNISGNILSLLYYDDFISAEISSFTGSCFSYIFSGDSGLINAKNLILPSINLSYSCFEGMFQNCTSLITAPELPATTLNGKCYDGMFFNCTSLTTAPVLPATTLVFFCYQGMFKNCSSLNYIKAMFTTTPSTSYTSNWVSGVAANGTFVKNSTAEWNVTDIYGVPSGWTVETADN